MSFLSWNVFNSDNNSNFFTIEMRQLHLYRNQILKIISFENYKHGYINYTCSMIKQSFFGCQHESDMHES